MIKALSFLVIGFFSSATIGQGSVLQTKKPQRERCRHAFENAPPQTLVAQRSYTSNHRCPSVSRVSPHQMRGQPKLKYDSIVMASIPKVGSTTIRDDIIPQMAPRYKQSFNGRNAAIRHKGEENGFYPCESMNGKDGEVDFKFIFVRDPLSRFLSGLHEVVSHHKEVWAAWRRQNDKKELCKNCPIEDYIAEYLKDMKDGWFNSHTHFQTGFLYHPNTTWPDYVGRIEHAQEDWTKIRKMIGLPDSVPPIEFPGDHSSVHTLKTTSTLQPDSDTSSATSLQRVLVTSDDDPMAEKLILSNGSTFSMRAWGLFCEFYRPDYLCAGYNAPRQCLELWGRNTP